jgi:hypothetical protein
VTFNGEMEGAITKKTKKKEIVDLETNLDFKRKNPVKL